MQYEKKKSQNNKRYRIRQSLYDTATAVTPDLTRSDPLAIQAWKKWAFQFSLSSTSPRVIRGSLAASNFITSSQSNVFIFRFSREMDEQRSSNPHPMLKYVGMSNKVTIFGSAVFFGIAVLVVST